MNEESKQSQTIPSIFEEKLIEQKKILQNCQKDHNLTSCLSCSEVIGCSIRKKYVIAVYESMNKGASGGFEF